MPFLGFGVDRPLASLPEWRGHIFGSIDIVAEDTLSSTIYAATEYFITRASDVPANQMFDGTLQGDLRIDESIMGGDGFGGFVQNVSEFSLINAEGDYDEAADRNSINGQTVTVRLGEVVDGVVAPFAQHELIAVLQGERWRVSRAKLTLETRDPAAALDVPVQQSIYAGTGGLEGGPELANKRRPKAFGRLFNASPTLVIGAEGLWQVNDGAVTGITAVKDGGIALTFVADYATVALLRAAIAAGTIAPGSWGSCNAEGYFGIGGVAFKQVTCDAAGLTLTTADIIEEVALASAGLTAPDLEAWTFDQLNEVQGAEIGYFLDSESSETCREMFDKLTRAIGGYAGMTAQGTLKVGRFDAPVSIAAEHYDLNGGNLVDVDRGDLPDALDPPPRRRRVAFARNWTIQTELFGQVSEGDPELAAYLGRPYKLASTTDAEADAVLADYPYAPDPAPVESYFALEADAQAEADRLHAFDVVGFKAYRCRIKNALRLHAVGHVIRVVDTSVRPRLSLDDGKYIRLASVMDDFGSQETEVVGIG